MRAFPLVAVIVASPCLAGPPPLVVYELRDTKGRVIGDTLLVGESLAINGLDESGRGTSRPIAPATPIQRRGDALLFTTLDHLSGQTSSATLRDAWFADEVLLSRQVRCAAVPRDFDLVPVDRLPDSRATRAQRAALERRVRDCDECILPAPAMLHYRSCPQLSRPAPKRSTAIPPRAARGTPATK